MLLASTVLPRGAKKSRAIVCIITTLTQPQLPVVNILRTAGTTETALPQKLLGMYFRFTLLMNFFMSLMAVEPLSEYTHMLSAIYFSPLACLVPPGHKRIYTWNLPCCSAEYFI